MNNFKLTIAYDGSRYNGWQRQGNTPNTVQGKIEAVLSQILGEKTEIFGSGRTDAGVHALGQVASFKSQTRMTPSEIMDSLNRYLPKDIAASDVRYAPERFHARLSVKEKVYTYRIWTAKYTNVFERKYMYHLGRSLDIEKMKTAAELMKRKADFVGYSSLKRVKKSTVREVKEIEILSLGSEVRMVFTGDGFLYNMVRIMAGTLVEVGLGLRSPQSVSLPFQTLSRSDAGETLPPCALVLTEVRY